MDTVLATTNTVQGVHEVVSAFQSQGMALSRKLTEMLNEHFSHQTERRGCGYTQATRVLAEFINQPRSPVEFDDFKLFDDMNLKSWRDIMTQAELHGLHLTSWRNLDINPAVQEFLQQHAQTHTFAQVLGEQVDWQHRLRHIHQQVEREESLLLVNIIQDIILPPQELETTVVQLPVLGEKPKVGSCPMAEKFFLEIAHRKIPRRGLVNVFIDQQQKPVLIEKINMGDDHSCISLVPIQLNGVRLPAGSSFSVAYDEQAISKYAAQFLRGYVMPLSECQGFWFLRLTTLAISPKNRRRAFSTHFQQQIDNDLFSPDITALSQLAEVAEQQMVSMSDQ